MECAGESVSKEGVESRLGCALVQVGGWCSCFIIGVGLLSVGVEQVGVGFGLEQGSA